jgi:hypothetical protein
MLPHQREAYIQGITKEGDEEPAGAEAPRGAPVTAARATPQS